MANLKVYILLTLSIFGLLPSIQGQDKIIGGSTTTIDKAPYAVYMRYDGSYRCDGTLIRTTKVLSAAHCVKDEQLKNTLPASGFIIHAGTSYLSNEGMKSSVAQIAVSGNFNKDNSLTYDVSILTLTNPLTGPNIAIAPLCSSPMSSGDTVKVLGWGLTDGDVNSPSNQLRAVMLNTITDDSCDNVYGNGAITQTMMCCANPGKGTCHGDSGGPLMKNGEVCGIVSWGDPTCKSGYPSVFTRVNQVLPFINNNI